MTPTREALRTGYEHLLGWAEVLDRINVFPVADGDTGRNLLLSLAPLRDCAAPAAEVESRLLVSARGNSGNIANEFVRALLTARSAGEVPARFAAGAEAARRAVSAPKEGTMLTTLDAAARLTQGGLGPGDVERLLRDLTLSVQATRDGLEPLRQAGVVDSGALGMLAFLDGFLRALFALPASYAIEDAFGEFVRSPLRTAGSILKPSGCCVDAVLRVADGARVEVSSLERMGSDVIARTQGDLLKVHLHVQDAQKAKAEFGRLGEIVRWSWDDWAEQASQAPAVTPEGSVHVMTDAAASLTRQDARALGITLLDSYVSWEGESLPETLTSHEAVYAAMRGGARIATSQASIVERDRHYERLARHHLNTLYVCVGSAYTGIYAHAAAWAKERGATERVLVLDSGAASGRLAVALWEVARRAVHEQSATALGAYAERALARAEEYVFLDKLSYLARGGRVGRVSAAFADLVSIAPVIAPMPEGVRRVAVLRTLEQKVTFACARLRAALMGSGGRGLVLLEHSDNRAWVETELAPRVRELLPSAECHVRPLSLTSGVHMGPGTWAVAVLPAAVEANQSSSDAAANRPRGEDA